MRKEAAEARPRPEPVVQQRRVVTAEKIGIETTTYVRNIFKYYAAYKLALDAQEATRKAREQATPR